MKALVCLLLLVLVAAACGAEEKKNEKRGLLGLGYGLHSAPLISHGVGLDYEIGLGYGGLGLGLGYGGHGIVAPAVGHGGYSAPLLGHALFGSKLSYGAPLLGLGHGYLH